VHEPAALRARDPAGVAARSSEPAVEGQRRLVGHERTLLRHPGAPGFVLSARPPLELAAGQLHLDVGFTEAREALTGRLRVGVGDRGDYPAHARGDDGIGAGRRAAVMSARLEADVERRAPSPLAGRLERHDLGVRTAGSLVPAFPDDLAVANEDCADQRVGTGRAPPTLG